MRILQIHNQYKEWGGEDAVVENEYALLTNAGHEVYRPHAINSTVGSLLPDKKAWYRSLITHLDSVNVDVAHIHNLYSVIGNSVYPLLSKRKVKIVQTLHNYRLLCANACFLDPDNKICERCAAGNVIHGIIKKCYRNSYSQSAFMAWQIREGRDLSQQYVNKFIAVSDFVKKKYEQHGFEESKIIVKPNHVNRPHHGEQTTDEKYALYIGRLSPEKGILNLIDVFLSNGFNLKVAGNGPLELVLKQRANGAKNIHFLGHLRGEEKENILRACSFVIVPSEWFETFGMVVQEAYTYDKVVLAANIGALPSHIKDPDHLFEPGSFISLHKCVETQINKHQLKPDYLRLLALSNQPDPVEQLVNIYR